MNKTKRNRRPGSSRGRPAQTKSAKVGKKLIPLVIIAALVAGGLYVLQDSRQKKSVTAGNSHGAMEMARASSGPYKLRETRPTLSRILFVGAVAEAYGVAKEIPEVLDQLYCYCRCAENFGHKSLLSCYVDQHAAT